MADTSVQMHVEKWIRSEWMPKKYGQSFSKRKISLISGGVFEFDAVSEDGKIAAVISTSGAKTASGKNAIGKTHKIRSDLYFLSLVEVPTRLVVLIEKDMYDYWIKEVKNGRVHLSTKFILLTPV